MLRIIIAVGFVLYLYDGASHRPINRAPWHQFETQETCQADLIAWSRLAPEWLAVCREGK